MFFYMKSENLKLAFVETGRLENGEMSQVYGGGTVCGIKVICTTQGLNSCTTWSSCSSKKNFSACGYKSWVMEEVAVAVSFSAVSNDNVASISTQSLSVFVVK
jgi:hypothetical protein